MAEEIVVQIIESESIVIRLSEPEPINITITEAASALQGAVLDPPEGGQRVMKMFVKDGKFQVDYEI